MIVIERFFCNSVLISLLFITQCFASAGTAKHKSASADKQQNDIVINKDKKGKLDIGSAICYGTSVSALIGMALYTRQDIDRLRNFKTYNHVCGQGFWTEIDFRITKAPQGFYENLQRFVGDLTNVRLYCDYTPNIFSMNEKFYFWCVIPKGDFFEFHKFLCLDNLTIQPARDLTQDYFGANPGSVGCVVKAISGNRYFIKLPQSAQSQVEECWTDFSGALQSNRLSVYKTTLDSEIYRLCLPPVLSLNYLLKQLRDLSEASATNEKFLAFSRSVCTRLDPQISPETSQTLAYLQEHCEDLLDYKMFLYIMLQTVFGSEQFAERYEAFITKFQA